MRINAQPSPKVRCALCHAGGAGLRKCSCATAVHSECLEEFGGCPTCGTKPRRETASSDTSHLHFEGGMWTLALFVFFLLIFAAQKP